MYVLRKYGQATKFKVMPQEGGVATLVKNVPHRKTTYYKKM